MCVSSNTHRLWFDFRKLSPATHLPVLYNYRRHLEHKVGQRDQPLSPSSRGNGVKKLSSWHLIQTWKKRDKLFAKPLDKHKCIHFIKSILLINEINIACRNQSRCCLPWPSWFAIQLSSRRNVFLIYWNTQNNKWLVWKHNDIWNWKYGSCYKKGLVLDIVVHMTCRKRRS